MSGNSHERMFKNRGLDIDAIRKRHETNNIEIRKQKQEEQVGNFESHSSLSNF